MNRGKFVVLLLFVVGTCMAGFAWWHRYERGQQVLNAWGSDISSAIRLGSRVDLLRLTRLDANPDVDEAILDSLRIGNQRRRITERRDVSKARGLIHARHALLQREAFRWVIDDPACRPNWEYALRFHHASQVATLALDFECQRVYLLERDRQAGMAPIAGGLQTFVGELTSAASN